MTVQEFKTSFGDPQFDEIVDICLKYGVPRSRAALVAGEVKDMIDNPIKTDCASCTRPFRTNDPRAIYCSKSCKQTAYLKRQPERQPERLAR